MEIETAQGNTVQGDDQIALKFENFYTSLYTADPSVEAAAVAYVAQAEVASLPAIDADKLDADIKPDEVLRAIQGLAPGKAPGEDGFSSYFYKILT